jgi:large subunit ribosomal protein L21
MNAVIKQGGKQYTVQTGGFVSVEKIDAEIGTEISVPVVMTFENGKINTKTGNVSAVIVEHGKGPKIHGFKYKPKNNVRKKFGHRQPYTKIKIGEVK